MRDFGSIDEDAHREKRQCKNEDQGRLPVLHRVNSSLPPSDSVHPAVDIGRKTYAAKFEEKLKRQKMKGRVISLV